MYVQLSKFDLKFCFSMKTFHIFSSYSGISLFWNPSTYPFFWKVIKSLGTALDIFWSMTLPFNTCVNISCFNIKVMNIINLQFVQTLLENRNRMIVCDFYNYPLSLDATKYIHLCESCRFQKYSSLLTLCRTTIAPLSLLADPPV